MFEEKAERFIDEYVDGMRLFDEGTFVSQLQSEIFPFRDREKINLLTTIKTDVEKRKFDHEQTCSSSPEKCNTTKKFNKALMFISQEMEELGIMADRPTDFPNSEADFSESQMEKLHEKIDDVLYKLDKMGLGQEIIYEEIEQLKNDAGRVTKKDLGLMVIGKIVEYGSTEVSKIPEVQELYKYITNTVKGLPPFKL
jgi:hypothetical protein